MSDAQKPVAYLKFWTYQQVTQDGNVNADEGLEVCREGEIGMDGVKALPVYIAPTLTPPDGWAEVVTLAKWSMEQRTFDMKNKLFCQAILDMDAKIKEVKP